MMKTWNMRTFAIAGLMVATGAMAGHTVGEWASNRVPVVVETVQDSDSADYLTPRQKHCLAYGC